MKTLLSERRGNTEEFKDRPAFWIDTIAADLFPWKPSFVEQQHPQIVPGQQRRARSACGPGTDNNDVIPSINERGHGTPYAAPAVEVYRPSTNAALIPPNPKELERIWSTWAGRE